MIPILSLFPWEPCSKGRKAVQDDFNVPRTLAVMSSYSQHL